MSATHACKEIVWLKRLLGELGVKQNRVIIHCNSECIAFGEKTLGFMHELNTLMFNITSFSRQQRMGWVDHIVEDPHSREYCRYFEKPVAREKFVWTRASLALVVG